METSLIESILFLESEPVDLNTLIRITKLSREAVKKAIEDLQKEYKRDYHGIELILISDGYCFSPKKELWTLLKDRYGKKSDKKLSRAALETLAIIAYSQPITKAEIESIRGVSADSMIKLLVSYSLVKEMGKKDIPGKPIQYGTTKDFLRFFRLASIADLPKLDDTEKERFDSYE
jgi:segregation and condensation protein B